MDNVEVPMPAHRILLGCVLVLALPVAESFAHNCQCRNRGVMFKLGQTACLRVDGRTYLARCEMKLNVSSWTETGESCPVTSRQSNVSKPLEPS